MRSFQSLIKNRKCICENICIFNQHDEVDFVARGRHHELSGIYYDDSYSTIIDQVKKGHPITRVPAITLLELLEKHNS